MIVLIFLVSAIRTTRMIQNAIDVSKEDPTFLMINTSRKAAIGEVKVMEAVPHNPMPEADGTAQMIAYGSSPLITRLDGYGNGNRSLELTAESEQSIIEQGYLANPTYDYGRGPINIKVVDPLNLASGYFECKFDLISAYLGEVSRSDGGVKPPVSVHLIFEKCQHQNRQGCRF